MNTRERLDEYAKINRWDTNKLIGWSEAADFASWCVEKEMELMEDNKNTTFKDHIKNVQNN